MRREHEQYLGARLTITAVGSILLLVPFGLIAAAIVGDVGWLHGLDQRVTDAMHGVAATSPRWVDVMAMWSLVFDPNVWRVGTFLLMVWLLRRGVRDLAVWVAVTMITGGVLNAVLKLIFERHRPEFLDPVARAAGYSFPSGHALNNALGAAVVLLVLLPFAHGWKRIALWAGVIVVPLVTAYSRVLLGVHWTSDVTAGLLLGVAVVTATATAYLARRRRLARSHPAADGLEPDLARNA